MSNKERFIELIKIGLPVECNKHDKGDFISAMQGLDLAFEQDGYGMGRWDNEKVFQEAMKFIRWIVWHRLDEEHKPEWVILG